MKTIMVTLNEEILDTELGKDTAITIDTNNYTGKIIAIIAHSETATPTEVTLEAQGLKVKTATS